MLLALIASIHFIESAATKKADENFRIHHRKKKKRPCKGKTSDGRTFLFVGDIVVNQVSSGGPGYVPGGYVGANSRPGLLPCSSNHFSHHSQGLHGSHGSHGSHGPHPWFSQNSQNSPDSQNSHHGGLFGGMGLFGGSGGLFSGGGLLNNLGIPSLFGSNGWFGGIAQNGLGLFSGGTPVNSIMPQADEEPPEYTGPEDNGPEVYEDVPEDEVIEDQYTPGALVGAPNHQVNGYMQNVNNLFSKPTKFVKGIGKGAYSYLVNPFVELLQKRR